MAGQAHDWAVINDGHTHLGFDALHGPDGGLTELLAEMTAHHVSRAAVITPAAAGLDNGATVRAVRQHPDRFVGIGRLDISSPSAPQACAELITQGLQGVRFTTHAAADLGWPTAKPLAAVAEMLTVHGAVAEFHASPAELPLVHRFAAQHSELCVLIDHGGRPDPTDRSHYPRHPGLAPLAELPNVIVKTPNSSFFSRSDPPHRDLAIFHAWLLEVFGADRVMWGSDWPACLAGGPYTAALEAGQVALELASSEEIRKVTAHTFTSVFGPAQRQPQ